MDVKALKDGLHKGLTYDQYNEIDAARSSDLRAFDRTPQHAKWRLDIPQRGRELDMGIAAHYLILQPERFARNVIKLEKISRRSNAGKAAAAERERKMTEEGFLGLEPADWDAAHRMRDAVMRHPVAKRLLQGAGLTEATVLWTDEESGFRCKAEIDRAIWHYESPWQRGTDQVAVIDVKTSKTTELWLFERDVIRYGYDIQAAHYLTGLNSLAQAPRKWVWIVVENVPPHVVRIMEFHDSGVEQALKTWRGRLNTYAACKKANHWPGWPGFDGTGIDSANLPTWAFREGDE